MRLYCLTYTTALGIDPLLRTTYFPTTQEMLDRVVSVRQTDPKCVVHAVDALYFPTGQDLADFLNRYETELQKHRAASSPHIERSPNEMDGA